MTNENKEELYDATKVPDCVRASFEESINYLKYHGVFVIESTNHNSQSEPKRWKLDLGTSKARKEVLPHLEDVPYEKSRLFYIHNFLDDYDDDARDFQIEEINLEILKSEEYEFLRSTEGLIISSLAVPILEKYKFSITSQNRAQMKTTIQTKFGIDIDILNDFCTMLKMDKYYIDLDEYDFWVIGQDN